MKTYLATLILALIASTAQAGMAEVQQADQAIEQAKAQRKAALKGLTKVERAQLNLVKAQKALDKAQGRDTLDAPVTRIKPAKAEKQA